MPLPKRVVEPVFVSRGTIPANYPLPSELETCTNGTLANTIRQLSSLSRHAEDLFGELTRDVTQISERTNSLQARVDRLAVKVTQLDSTVEEVSLQDIHMRKAFKSGVVFDQQVFSRATMPTAMLEIYKSCDRPPPLDKLNCYRDDGKDGLKFYTDPNYFFELWSQEMLKDTERMMHDRAGKKPHRPRDSGNQSNANAAGGRHKKRVRQPHNTRERQRQIAVGHGEHIMPQNVQYRTGQSVILSSNYAIDNPPPGMVMTDAGRPLRPSSIEIRRSYPSSEVTDSGIASQANYNSSLNNGSFEYASTDQVGQISSESLYNQSLGGLGSPTRRIRPTQPPPAPPSGTTTPSGSATGTPTRGRSMSAGRDQLPPPPPPPEGIQSPPMISNMNGVSMAAHILARTNNTSRNGSPLHNNNTILSPPSGGKYKDVNKIDMNYIDANDLPPPPPVPNEFKKSPPKNNNLNASIDHQTSLSNNKISEPIPPPPPPLPPPMQFTNGFSEDKNEIPATTNASQIELTAKSAVKMNGDISMVGAQKSSLKILGCSPPKLTPMRDRVITAKVLPTSVHDPRNDLLKAIRDGIKLRKVEKNEQKETERFNTPCDVASILARRVAVEYSDSDSATDSEYDSEGWGEENQPHESTV